MSPSDQILLTILSPERKLLEKAATRGVLITTSEGEIEILPGHAKLIGILEPGRFRCQMNDGQSKEGFISTGTFNVEDNHLTVFAEVVEWAGEISLDRAKKAQAQAERELMNPALEPSHFKKYQLKLQRSILRQNISSTS